MSACQEETEKNRKKPLESVLGRCCVSPALAEGQFNRLIHGGKGRVDGLAVSHSETRGLEVAEFPRAICRDFAVPREDDRKGKEEFECSGGKHSGLGGKSVSGNERAVSDVQK